EPYAQRRMAALHDGPGRQSRLAAAFATGQDAWTRGDAERFADLPAMGAGETLASSGPFQDSWRRPRRSGKVAESRGGISETQPRRGGERPSLQRFIQATIDNYLHLVGVCVNRIGTERRSRGLRTGANWILRFYVPRRNIPDLNDIERTDLASMSRQELEELAWRWRELARSLANRAGEDSKTSSRPPSSDDPYRRDTRGQPTAAGPAAASPESADKPARG